MSITADRLPHPHPPRAMPMTARTVLHLLDRLRGGRLELQLPDGSTRHFGSSGELAAQLQVRDWRVFDRVLKAGDIGFAEGWIEGEWTSPDPTTLLRLMLANRAALDDAIHGSLAGKWLLWLKHRLQRNSRRGSRRNIHAHYDLGNAFYALWLDETMSYSSALFGGNTGLRLEAAQRVKMRRAISELALQPGQRLLEIGCGWGALAEEAVREFGLQVTGVTLSREQLAFGQRRIAQAGVEAGCLLRYADYRDLPALYGDLPFDGIVSIEMFEAVGEAYWRDYFSVLRRCLKPGGRACIQTIAIRDDLYERYRRSTDFIQQYIFPGGHLPSPATFRAECQRAGFEVEREYAFGEDYAETLRRWRVRFLAQLEELPALGFDERFVRIWHFYLAYCEAAFAAGDTTVLQVTLRRA
jgi:cyclopropane-fatty-acyl-phospholipid synthase